MFHQPRHFIENCSFIQSLPALCCLIKLCFKDLLRLQTQLTCASTMLRVPEMMRVVELNARFWLALKVKDVAYC